MTIYLNNVPASLLKEAQKISDISAEHVRKLIETGDIVYMDERNRIVKRSPNGIIRVINDCPAIA